MGTALGVTSMLLIFIAYIVFIVLIIIVLFTLLKTLKSANEYLEIKIKDSKKE